MHSLNSKKELQIKLNTEELTPTQVRIIKAVHGLIANVLTADEEAEYFEMSAELMRKTAELIKHSSFGDGKGQIDYGEQAVEYAVDFLNESLDHKKLTNFDN